MTVELIELTPEKEPSTEVIAVDGKGNALVGYVDWDGNGYQCESEDIILKNVTHFIHIPRV